MEGKPADPESNRKRPRWPWAAWAVYLVVVFTCNAFAASMATSALVVILVLFELGLVFVTPVVAYARFRAGKPGQVLGAITLPMFVGGMLISTPLAEWAGDTASFYRVRSSLQREVDRMPGDDGKKLVVLGVDGFLDSVHGYVYDGSDEVGLPAGKQSEAWKKRAIRTELEDLCFRASHITGHYYSFSTQHGCNRPPNS